MPAPKYAKKVDLNQQEILDALRQIPGCDVVVIGQPVDLLVGYKCRNLLIEVKQPGEKPRTRKQREFLRMWHGQVRVCQSPLEAVELVLNAYETHYDLA